MGAATQTATEWWQTFFDEDYALIWSDVISPAETAAQCAALWTLLGLSENSRVLDAGCGYGRLALPLAQRGAVVVGVDQAPALLAIAERNRNDLPASRLRYMQHDLRQRLDAGSFDAAFNVFTGIGYGTEEDDLAILTTVHHALRPAGLFLLEAIQRDAVAAFLSHGGQMSRRRADGILVHEQTMFDPIESRIQGTWYWAGTGTVGEKTASMRVYTIGELTALLNRAGFRIRDMYCGISLQPFKSEPPQMGGRIGILAQRED